MATISKASKKATPKKKVRHYNLFLGLAVNKIRIELISQFILLKSGDGLDAASKDDPWEYNTEDEVFEYRPASDIILSNEEIGAIQAAVGESGNGAYLVIYTSSFDDDGLGLLYIELPGTLFQAPGGK